MIWKRKNYYYFKFKILERENRMTWIHIIIIWDKMFIPCSISHYDRAFFTFIYHYLSYICEHGSKLKADLDPDPITNDQL